MKQRLYGIVCANITPMDQKGEVDFASLRKLVETALREYEAE